MSIDVNVQNDLVIVTETTEDIVVNVSNAAGPQGPAGAAGVGVPVGGTTGQVLKKFTNTNYDTYWAADASGLTSVGLSVPTGLTVTNSPLTSNGTIAVGLESGYSIPTTASQATWNTAYNDSIVSAGVTGTSTKTLTLNQQDGGTVTASWSDIDTGLTSVGLSMPSAFAVSNSPLTSNGTLAVTGAGTADQYVRGDGQLANFPTNGGGGSSVNYYLNGSVSQGTFGGDTYYEMSKTPIAGAGTNFTRTNAQGNGYIASFITDAGDPALLNIPGGNWNVEFYFQASSSGSTPSFYAELYKVSSSNVFTLIASGSTNPEGITQGTVVDQYFTSIPVPQTALLATDRLAIRIFVTPSGRTITLHTENSNLCEVLTTFSTGLNALNGLTAQVQYFATGTSGTDFAISSATDTHTFNLPTASGTNRGALSSADWTTFNGKVGGSGATGQVAYWNGTNSQTGSNNLFWDAANSRLGIGTNAPTYKLDVQGTIGTVAIRAASNTAGDILYYATGSVTGSTDAFRTAINATGNVAAFLANSNSATGSSVLDISVPSASTGDPYISFTTSGATNWSIGIDNSDGDKLKIGPVSNPSNSSTAIVAHTTGNISLNSSVDAGFKLDVNGTARVSGAALQTGTGIFRTENTGVNAPSGSVGVGAEMFVSGGKSYYTSYNRTSNAYAPLVVYGSTLEFFGAATFSSSVTAGDALTVTSNTSTSYALNIIGRTTAGNASTINFFNNAASTRYGFVYVDSSTFEIGSITGSNIPLVFSTNQVERARFTSGGNLGLGTTSPANKLDVINSGTNSIRVQNTLNTADAYLIAQNTLGRTFFGINGTGGYIYNEASLPILFYTAATERMRLDSSGNLGLGVTPSAWGGSYKAIQISSFASIAQGGNDTYIGNNWYNDGSNKYLITSAASISGQSSGSHIWLTAPSGTAGTVMTLTTRMTLTNGGNLLVGTTTDAGQKLQVNGTSYFNGNVGIGIASATRNLEVSASSALLAVVGTSGTVPQLQLISGGVVNWSLRTNQGSASDFTIYQDSTERIRIASGGNFGIGVTPTAALDISASTTARATMRIRSGVAPTTPSDGDIWFDGTDLKMRIGGVTKTFTLL